MNKICVLCLVLLTLTSTALLATEINFFDGSWEQAQQKARAENKLIFMDAFTTWCGPCKMMEKYTFTDADVAAYYNANFVNVRYDMEAYPGTALSEQYTVMAYPTLLFIDGNGKLVHRGCGALGADEFITLGRNAQDPAQQLASLQQQFEAGERSAEFLGRYKALLDAACLDGSAVMANIFDALGDDDLLKPTNWALMQEHVQDVYSREFQYVLANRAKFAVAFGQDEVNNFIDRTLGKQYLSITEGEGAQAFALAALAQAIQTHGHDKDLAYYIAKDLAEANKNWAAYTEATAALVEKNQIEDPEELNQYAWKFYLYASDAAMLQKALIWAKSSVATAPNASNTDTLASLHFKLGNKAEALKLSEEALEMANDEGADTEHYEKQLAKFKASL